MTMKELRAIARSYGCTVIRTVHGEYRINLVDGLESTAYYTDDAQDAVNTMRAMSTNPNVRTFDQENPK